MNTQYITIIIGTVFPWILYRQELNCKAALKIFRQLESQGYDISGIIEKYDQCIRKENEIWGFISSDPEKFMPEFRADLPIIPHELNVLLFELETCIFDLQSILLQKGFTFDLLIPLRINNLFGTAWGEHKFNGNSEALRWGYYQETLARPFNIKRVAEVYRDQVIPKVYPFGPHSTDNIITQIEAATSTDTISNTKINENTTNIDSTSETVTNDICNNTSNSDINKTKTDTYLIKSMADYQDADYITVSYNYILPLDDGKTLPKLQKDMMLLYRWIVYPEQRTIIDHIKGIQLVKSMFNIDLLDNELILSTPMVSCIIHLASLITIREYYLCLFTNERGSDQYKILDAHFDEILKERPNEYQSKRELLYSYLCNTNKMTVLQDFCSLDDYCMRCIDELDDVLMGVHSMIVNLIETNYFRDNYEAEAHGKYIVWHTMTNSLINWSKHVGEDPYLDKILGYDRDKKGNLIKNIEEINNIHSDNNDVLDYWVQWPNIYMYALTYTLLFVFNNWSSLKEIIMYFPKYYVQKYLGNTNIYKYFKKISKLYLTKISKYIRITIDKCKNIF